MNDDIAARAAFTCAMHSRPGLDIPRPNIAIFPGMNKQVVLVEDEQDIVNFVTHYLPGGLKPEDTNLPAGRGTLRSPCNPPEAGSDRGKATWYIPGQIVSSMLFLAIS